VEVSPERHVISIGKPIANTRIYVLDPFGQLQPIGTPGEIHIGGVGVSGGYWNRPELTANRFLPDVVDARTRMYRTGDLGYWCDDGTLVYLGRADDQVKVRGHRIELGEIATKLRQHPQVRDAVVLVREDPPGNKRLVAYVLPLEATVSLNTVQPHLQALLPDYMLPSFIVTVREWPRTPNGKLDYKALPAPGPEAVTAGSFEPPQGEVESRLAEVWRGLLGVDRIGRHDNFFASGGHSLLAIRLVANIREIFLTELSLVSVVENPTVSAQAQLIGSCEEGVI
jgi:hypothetical protein